MADAAGYPGSGMSYSGSVGGTAFESANDFYKNAVVPALSEEELATFRRVETTTKNRRTVPVTSAAPTGTTFRKGQLGPVKHPRKIPAGIGVTWYGIETEQSVTDLVTLHNILWRAECVRDR